MIYIIRVPHFGRDMAFSREISELYIVGCRFVFKNYFYFNLNFSSQIFRLNLEQGTFLEPFTSSAPSLNCCQFNNDHQLFVCGTADCRVEAWDHRDRSRVATLDCALNNGIALELDFDNLYVTSTFALFIPFPFIHLGHFPR